MTKYRNYEVCRVGNIPKSKLKKAMAGGTVSLTPTELSGTCSLVLHPTNAKKVKAAQASKKGTRIQITPGEIEHDQMYSREMQGGSLWDDIVSGVKTGVKWLGTQALDGIAQGTKGLLGDSTLGNKAVDFVRSGVKDLTGMGVSGGKVAAGSTAAKEKMAKLRAIRAAKKSQGGSFRLS